MTLALVGRGSSSRAVARVLDADQPSNAVDGRVVQFLADGDGIGADVTDGQGRAEAGIQPRYRGAGHTFGAEFAGDDWFRSGAAEKRR